MPAAGFSFLSKITIIVSSKVSTSDLFLNACETLATMGDFDAIPEWIIFLTII